jgi:ABC-type multidrug transport system fused ATPase/permease subunit
MTHYKTLLTSLPKYFSGVDFLLLILLICALIVTFCWSVLGNRLKLAIYFTAGVFLFRSFFEHLIDKNLFPDLHSYLPFVLGFVTAGLLEISAYLIANRTMIIGIFFIGAIFPIFFFAHSILFDYEKGLVAPVLTAIAAAAIFSILAMSKIIHARAFQLVASAIAGALGTVYLAALPGGPSELEILVGVGANPYIRMAQNTPLLHVIYLSISGFIVQSLLYLVSRRIRCQKSESSKCRTRVQNAV